MVNWYERTGQKIAILHESSYGTPTGGSQWSALSAGETALNEINIIPTGIEVPVPKINKIRKYDIGKMKYPSDIASGNIDPISFSLELELQYPVFLAYAIGLATSTDAGSPYTHDIEEDLSTDLQSFTMHCEQNNDTDDNDIAYDLFGCVVDEYSLRISKGDETIRENVTIKAPYASIGSAINTGGINSMTDEIHVWNELHTQVESGDEIALGTQDRYFLQEGTGGGSDIAPDSIESVSLRITNNVNFLPTLEKRHMAYATATSRDVELSISGYISNKDIWKYWQEAWDQSNNRPTSASGVINANIYLERGTDDYIYIPINSLIPVEHSCEFASIDDGIKGADITLVSGVSEADSGRLFYDTDNSKNIEVKDTNDNTWYHNTTS